MTDTHLEATAERRNRRRGLLLALLLHGAVVGGFVYPFFVGASEPRGSYELLVELDFRDPLESAAAASASARERNEVKRPTVEREAAPRKPAPPTPTPVPAPAPPILTAPDPEPVVEDVPKPTPTATTVTKTPTVVVDAPTPNTETSASAKDAHSRMSGTASASGAPEVGTETTVADAGAGRSDTGSGLEGTGVLSRAIVYRPRLNSLVRANGRMAMNVCVNPSGNVVAVKWNEELSTIHDLDLVRDAMAKAREYKFANAPNAPRRECGVVTIIVKGLDHLH